MSQSPVIAQVRHARSTSKLDEMVRFYRDGLGLPVLGGFEDHNGYDGVMFGLPGATSHLELTADGGRTKTTSYGEEDLLVLYIPTVDERDRIVARLATLGYQSIPPANPYWIGKAVTVPDPDGFRIVLFAGLWEPNADLVPARFRASS